ncbi:MAG TPA: hypothetical protein P5277_00405 [Candidatus Paceibacterota bacterium]|nr:hypothetical protein [Candidatus Paceibacterota bacterium]
MGWKNWPYWLKGGIIGGIAWLLLIILFFLNQSIIHLNGGHDPNTITSVISNIILYVSFPIMLYMKYLDTAKVILSILIISLGTLVCFVLWGMLIGWIISKFKKNGKNKK